MKHNLQFGKSLKTLLSGAVVATAACTFTACDNDAIEQVNPNTTQTDTQSPDENGAVIPGKYIVVFKPDNSLRVSPGASYDQQVRIVKDYGTEVLRTSGIRAEAIQETYANAIVGMAVEMSSEEVNQLRNDKRVDYIEPDRVVMLAKPGSGGSTTAGQELPYGINRVGYASGAGKTAWVIDTGIDLDHPDLNVDAARSWSAFTTARDYTPDDNNGHGTHVAGTIAAKNNDIGVIGVAYDATVVAVKVLDHRGSGAYSGVIAGVDYVAANGKAGDAANMSLGGPVSQALDDAVAAAAAKGIKFAIAAGNDGRHAGNYSPARVNGTNIYTISAMDANNRWASFSNYGNPPVDYCAPGVNIKSTWKDGGYNTISGTSMASPHVAGLLLLGNINTDGYVSGDRDNSPDPIAHR
ncbi:MAG: S8 family serine peptidase [Hymenobacteraceae bacterium]|nr:S8 family serine peptidase [Hymenobacteraceae bacterium]MDX5396726.1 S8 family serine peptidase [Hymenobacteraceae bacterium]MDX5442316.1 S8 family serine peptidase [Hymenobacteraceae bacterium]MDX5512786.1 S8 family serine peptidase [Hymenobacteraceae bacterium]